MKVTIFTASLLCVVACTTPNEQQFVPVDNEGITYVGRISRAIDNEIRFTYPGVSIDAQFTGTSVAVCVKPNSGFFMVELDNQEPYKVEVSETDSVLTLSQSLAEGKHHLRLIYAQEGYEQLPAFRGLLIDKNAKMLEPTIQPNRRIEFIGNSITCGYGVEADSASEHFSYSTENHYYTYAAITARTLNAQELVVARSGIGIYKNYGGPITGTKGFTMPDKYELTLFTDEAVKPEMERWNHTLYIPDVVCLNLGTNDTSLDTYDTLLMKNAYINFVMHLRSTYPNAKIILLCGSMMNGNALSSCKAVLNEVLDDLHDGNVYRFDFTAQDGSLGYGADWHPSKRQQQLMADELIPFIREIMNWND